MLVMELYRLVPYKEDRYVHFHPFNMPHIKIRKIELIGLVMGVKRNASNLFLTSKRLERTTMKLIERIASKRKFSPQSRMARV